MFFRKNEDEEKFRADKQEYIKQSMGQARFQLSEKDLFPCLTDYKDQAGAVDGHYFFQDIYMAGKVRESGAGHIYDIGSRLDGYIAHLLSMNIRVTMIDIRPLNFQIDNLDFVQGDATNLDHIETDSIPALSCLHALEHFGLGRYGDPVDYHGWEKALTHFKRILTPGGTLYLSVPSSGTEKLMFNAHRIFHPCTIYDALSNAMDLREFSSIHGGITTTLTFDEYDTDIKSRLDAHAKEEMGDYDCGMYIFRKREPR